MQLDSSAFAIFVATVLLLRLLTPSNASHVLLLGASILFYAAASPLSLALLLVMIGLNYVAVSALGAWQEGMRRNLLFWTTVVGNVAILIFFRAAMAHFTNSDVVGSNLPTADAWLIPLGLSFFTIQMLACVTDVYRREYIWTTGVSSFFFFILLFPHV